MIDNVVVPVATGYGLADEYAYLKSSVQEFLTGLLHLICLCTLCYLVDDWNMCCVLFCHLGKELEKLALEMGFSNAKHYEIGGGIMGNLVAKR